MEPLSIFLAAFFGRRVSQKRKAKRAVKATEPKPLKPTRLW